MTRSIRWFHDVTASLGLLVAISTFTGMDSPAMAQDAATPTDPIILKAQQDKAQSEAKTAAYTAAAAEVTAKYANAKAAVDALPTSATTGATTTGADAGKSEATLLAAKATNEAARKIVVALGENTRRKKLTIFAGAERPALDHYNSFKLRLDLLQNAIAPKAQSLDDAAVAALRDTKFTTAAGGGHATAELAPMAIALGVSALTKLAGLFQTDYSVGGIGLTADDAALATAVTGSLLGAGENKPDSVTLFSRSTNVTASTDLITLLTPVAKNGAAAQARIAFFTERAKAIRADANAKDPKMSDAAAACDQAAAAWQLVVNGYDTLLQSLTTADASGNLPIAKVADEQRLLTALSGDDLLLFVQMNSSTGGYYTKKNLFTAFGAEPFFVAAGVVASYTLVNGKEGTTVAAGVIPVHGGYRKAPKVADYVNGAGTQTGTGTQTTKP